MKSQAIYQSAMSAPPGLADAELAGTVSLLSDGIALDLELGSTRQSRFFSFDEIRGLSEDRGLVTIYSDLLLTRLEIENTIIRTLPARQSIYDWKGAHPYVMITTPWKGCPISACELLAIDHGSLAHVGFSFGQPVERMSAWLHARLYSPITFDGPSTVPAGGSVAVRVTVPPNMTAYLDCDAGNLSHWRVKGEKEVMISAADLSAGESIKVKAGYRNWPGESDFTLQVTE